jgi:hypothetical protein
MSLLSFLSFRALFGFGVRVCAFLSIASCVLLISPDTYPGPCQLAAAGSETQCGICIRTRCQARVDDCCRDNACLPTLRAAEECSAKHDGRCDELRSGGSSNNSSNSSGSPLAACIVASCSLVCDKLVGVSQTRCKEPPLGEGNTCTCESAEQNGNDAICSSAVYPETVCCAPAGWPAIGQECTCQALRCTPSPEGCFCSLGSFTPDRRECSGLHCCIENDACSCKQRECFDFETKAPDNKCQAAFVGCKKGQVRVDSCSVRR